MDRGGAGVLNMRRPICLSVPELLRSLLLGAICAFAACFLAGPHGGAIVSLLIMFALMAAWALLSILILIDRWEG
ncbi:hypothetical protein KTQ54_06150 [Komagataeibacter oboediens]|nr:hypothetical protein [Komagataeibacter oboediens]